MAVKCVPVKWGFAHVCDACGAVGPLGDRIVDKPVDEQESNFLHCGGNSCLATAAGWHITEERDLCPRCT